MAGDDDCVIPYVELLANIDHKMVGPEMADRTPTMRDLLRTLNNEAEAWENRTALSDEAELLAGLWRVVLWSLTDAGYGDTPLYRFPASHEW